MRGVHVTHALQCHAVLLCSMQGQPLWLAAVPERPQWQLWRLEGSGYWRWPPGCTEPSQNRVQGGPSACRGQLLSDDISEPVLDDSHAALCWPWSPRSPSTIDHCLQAVPLIMKVLSKSMDSSLTTEKVELATVTRDDNTGKVRNGGMGALRRRGKPNTRGDGVVALAAACLSGCRTPLVMGRSQLPAS